MQEVWSEFTSFTAGYLCRSHCGSTPCSNNSLNSLQRPLKLSVMLHSANLRALDSPSSAVRNARPFVSVRVGDGIQQTEQGEWSEKLGEWRFGKTIIVDALAKDEISIMVSSCMCYELYVATIPVLTDSTNLGVLSIPVASVLRQLQLEDRDADGMVYATPMRAYDVIQGRHLHGSVRVSFETRSAPARCVADEFGEHGYDGDQAKGPSRLSSSPQPLPLHAGVDQLPLDWWKQFSTEIDTQANGTMSRSPEKGPTLPLWAQPHPAPWAGGATLDNHECADSGRIPRQDISNNVGRRLSAPSNPRARMHAECGTGRGGSLRPSRLASAF